MRGLHAEIHHRLVGYAAVDNVYATGEMKGGLHLKPL